MSETMVTGTVQPDEAHLVGDLTPEAQLAGDVNPAGAVSGDLSAAYGTRGLQGPKGDPGHTPVLGVDYWTEEDRAAIKAYIDENRLTLEAVDKRIESYISEALGGDY